MNPISTFYKAVFSLINLDSTAKTQKLAIMANLNPIKSIG
jgi:hypothetical protein